MFHFIEYLYIFIFAYDAFKKSFSKKVLINDKETIKN